RVSRGRRRHPNTRGVERGPQQPSSGSLQMNAVLRLHLISRVIALCLFVFTLPATAASADENTAMISFTTAEQFLVVIPVSINGAGPFNFLLDTGATNSDIDRRLADQLSLPRVGE